MINLMADRITSFFIKNTIIKSDDKEVYIYSFEILISTIMNLMAVILIAILANRLIETSLFYLSFIPLRMIAGGYHAKTHSKCLLILIIVNITYLILLHYLPISTYLASNAVSILISTLILVIYAPVVNENKPLTDEKIEQLRTTTRLLLIISISIILILMLLFQQQIYPLCYSFGLLTASLSLLISKTIRN